MHFGALYGRPYRRFESFLPPPLRLLSNRSRRPFTFGDRNLFLSVTSALAQSGLSPERLELEITESALMQEADATLTTLYKLRGLGVRISMDNFGTGYSSLNYLRKFPFDKIKIDQSFTRDMSDREDCLAIVRAVAALASSLGIETTAGGVETMEQLKRLQSEGCTECLCGFRRLRPGVPIERGHAFRSKAATCSDEGGRGVVAGMVS
jgi:EAL domain-containing protein (putative c-di-GMP-specific phosphodiesterase class I)